jgi:serine/threonine protein kinase
LEQSDDDLLKIFNTYATESRNTDAETSTSDLDIMRRCYVTTTVAVDDGIRGLYKGYIVDTQTNDDGSSVNVNVPVFIKQVMFKMSDSKGIYACIKREKIDYGILSKKSTDEICKLKVTFVFKIDTTTVFVFVISEFCEGHTISDFIKNVFPISPDAAAADYEVPKTIARKYATKFLIRLASELLNFILWLHSNRYVYVDIKPENFIVGVVKIPNTQEDWTNLFALPRIIRAIDFGALQEYSTYNKKITVIFTYPVMRSHVMDTTGTDFFGHKVDGLDASKLKRSDTMLLPPFAFRSTNFSNQIKSTDFPESYSSKLRFEPIGILPNELVYTSQNVLNIAERTPIKVHVDTAIYMDVYGAWVLILSLLWYCAPYYNVLLIKFMVLLRCMIVKDNSETIWGNNINYDFCHRVVSPYLQNLYSEASIDENLDAIDNTAHDDEIAKLKSEITALDARNDAIDIEKQTNDTAITKHKTKIKNLETYCEHTGPIYKEIAELFGNKKRLIGTLSGGGAGRTYVTRTIFRRKNKGKTSSTSTSTSKTRKRRQLKNKKKNNEN